MIVKIRICSLDFHSFFSFFLSEYFFKNALKAEMASINKPLEDETKTTNSYWVKIHNLIYITVLNNSVNSIVNSIQKKIREM